MVSATVIHQLGCVEAWTASPVPSPPPHVLVLQLRRAGGGPCLDPVWDVYVVLLFKERGEAFSWFMPEGGGAEARRVTPPSPRAGGYR